MIPLDFVLFPDHLDRVEYAMIGLHGRDADKHAFFPFVRQMAFLHTQWTLLSAPYFSPEASAVRRWFDKETNNREQADASARAIAQVIDSRIHEGIAPENIFLTGFSQGAVMALHTALRYPRRLGGVVALSGYLGWSETLAAEAHPSNNRLPIFIGHGRRDETLTLDHAQAAVGHLRDHGYSVEYHESDTGHRISSDAVKRIRAFFHRHMYGFAIDDPRAVGDHIVPF